MLETFSSLDEVFSDEAFDSLVAGIKEEKVERRDPDINKFLEVTEWVKEHGREPQKTTQIQERKLFSVLNAIRSNEDRKALVRPYDELGLLGE
ncbi:hypothetical protein [Streptococcus sp. zg-JUN1979]|uniref:hypothetical protein n=1 Tax=Streptococcus sp. zg-JUN1979 TaxID=3391450 RepID=UPI0039B0CBEF